jgi:hypothetical protein
VVIDGEIYQSCKVSIFTKKLGRVSIVFNVKADTDDVHILFTDMRSGTEEIVRHALERHRIEDFHRGAKHLGLGEYRFREKRSGAYTRAPNLFWPILSSTSSGGGSSGTGS